MKNKPEKEIIKIMRHFESYISSVYVLSNNNRKMDKQALSVKCGIYLLTFSLSLSFSFSLSL